MEMKTTPSRGRLFHKGGGDDAAQPTVDSIPTSPSPPSGPMTRARAKALHDKVNSLLFTCDFGSTLDGMLLHSDTLCILRYEPQALQQGWTSSGQGAAPKKGAAGNVCAGVSVEDTPESPPPPESPPEPHPSLRPHRLDLESPRVTTHRDPDRRPPGV
jgi:hypothetical protein